MKNLLLKLLLPVLGSYAVAPMAATAAPSAGKPTVVLVHGAFADSSSWGGVGDELIKRGYSVVAAANPLRGLRSDAEYVTSVVKAIDGPVVLVGHSYGGAVISNVRSPNVSTLVFVAAFIPDTGESALSLAAKFPGSTLGEALAPPVPQLGGANDLYIRYDKFAAQFAADVNAGQAQRMAVAQRPVTDAALSEASGSPTWKGIPSWVVYGAADKNIPAATIAWMAERAKAKKTVEVAGGSHALMVSNPRAVADMVVDAAVARPTVVSQSTEAHWP